MTEQALSESILPKELTGVLTLSGTRNIGKTLFAIQSEVPSRILFIDCEEKTSGLNEQVQFGAYHPVISEFLAQRQGNYDASEFYGYFENLIKKVEKDKFTVCVIDNIAYLESAIEARIKKMPVAYGVSPESAASGKYGGIWGAVKTQISTICNILYSKGIKCIIMISHLVHPWAGGQPVLSKMKQVGKDRWFEMAVLSLILIPGEHPYIPAALVTIDHTTKLKFNPEKGDYEIQRRLPLRLPTATFAELRRYLKEPADLMNPRPGERPTEEEIYPYSDKFTPAQLTTLAKLAEAAREGGDANGSSIVITPPRVEPRAAHAINNLVNKPTPSK